MEREFWDIIPQSYRRRGIGVALTIFLRALLNFVGVATLLPVLMLLLNPEGAKPNGLLDTIRQVLGIDSDTNNNGYSGGTGTGGLSGDKNSLGIEEDYTGTYPNE